jgi:three-Cys-motif partner protein
MPVDSGVGHSSITIVKERDFAGLLGLHMGIVRGILARHPKWPQEYYYIDTNAGPGCYEEYQCDGSPVIFLKTCAKLGMPYRAYFIENAPGTQARLYAAILDESNYDRQYAKVDRRDHSAAVPEIMATIPQMSYGLIYADPNGIPPFDMLRKAARCPGCQRVDILIRFSGAALKRNPDRGKLVDHLKGINKKYWLVQRPIESDKWQWSFLLGSNWPEFPQWESRGFYRIASPEGREILDQLNYTSEELEQRDQASFFTGPMPNTSDSPSLERLGVK